MPESKEFVMYRDLFNKIIHDKKWVLYCPKCKHEIDRENDISRENSNPKKMTISCSNCEKFTYSFDLLWYNIKSTDVQMHLMEMITDITEEEAWIWANELKYTHPTYYTTQLKERDYAKKEVNTIISKYNLQNPRIMIVGCNSCKELECLNIPFDINNSIAIDISKAVLKNVDTKYKRMRFCNTFIEDLSSETLDINNNRIGDKYYHKIDLCLALKVFQSPKLINIYNLRKSLSRIYNFLKPHGCLIISVAKNTCIMAIDGGVNVIKGIYKNKDLNESYPEEVVDILVDEIRSCGLYENVTVRYGTKDSFEYYIECERGE